jgi:hypothetical protein
MTSTASRRMAKLEGALRPREAVFAWLVEAQQYPSLEDHVRSIVDLPVEAAPLSVIGDRVEAAVRQDMKGQARDAIEAAARRAVGDAVFLFTLAIVLNTEALETARVEGLRATAVFFWMGSMLGGPRADDLPAAEVPTYRRELTGCWAQWRSVVDRLSLDVKVENEARARLEGQFFGGHEVLFADAATSWASYVDMVERLVGLADAMVWTNRPKAPRRSAGTEAGAFVEISVAVRVTRLADDARVRAYETLGERHKAVQIMERRLTGD